MVICLQDLTGSVKENYLQSLVLLYLPCESFSPKENGEKRLDVRVHSDNGRCFVRVRLQVYEKTGASELDEPTCEPLRLSVKQAVGKAFLAAAKDIFGVLPPWGTVTGIRPAKLAADYLTRLSPEQTVRLLCDDYMVLPERAAICVRTAQNERKLTETLADRTCSLYISVPFCPSKCRYCSFVSAATPRLLSLIPAYLEALLDELAVIAETVRALGLTLKTVYVGGGTPAILTAPQISRLAETVHTLFCMDGVEFTFEAGRPDCITFEKLKAMQDGGITRISINTQTANNEVLKAVGRLHTFEDYLECMNLARRAGIRCINTDLIAGLPGESTDSFCRSVERVAAAEPENITVHAFTLKRSSEYKTEHTASVDAASLAALDMVTYAAKYLTDAGFEPYYMYRQKNTVGNLENTGYAKNAAACLYNIYMMGEYHTIFAAGAGAVTKYVSRDRQRIERVFCPKYPYEYLDKEKYAGFDTAFAGQFYDTLYEG
ncbi:MAG: coproporphyrinogen dehydrogenase HemZ [Eubacteriales bacterium]